MAAFAKVVVGGGIQQREASEVAALPVASNDPFSPFAKATQFSDGIVVD